MELAPEWPPNTRLWLVPLTLSGWKPCPAPSAYTGASPRPLVCASPGGACAVFCPQGLGLPARKCLDNQAEDHRDASFRCLLVHRCPCTSLSGSELCTPAVAQQHPCEGQDAGGRIPQALAAGHYGRRLGDGCLCCDRAERWASARLCPETAACLQPASGAGRRERGWRAPACTLLSKSTRVRGGDRHGGRRSART